MDWWDDSYYVNSLWLDSFPCYIYDLSVNMSELSVYISELSVNIYDLSVDIYYL